MENKINILIVEDEAIVAMALCDKLEAEGYNVVGIANNGLKAIDLFKSNEVDLLLCDINIKGDFDGIETVRRITEIKPIPVIYLTAFSDADTVDRAKKTYPAAYVTKPYNMVNLRISIDVAVNNFALMIDSKAKIPSTQNTEKEVENSYILQVEDHIFLKQGYQFVKINQSDIFYLEAEDNYTTFVTTDKKYALRMSLSAILEKIHTLRLVRIHRSYAVNLKRVESFNDYEINVGKFTVPLSKNYKEDFLRLFMFK
jgi:two-component system, response regulator PdtaR